MHQCLKIDEILAPIFAELDAGYVFDSQIIVPPRVIHPDIEALRTLAGLARTCTAFHERALDILWRDIPDLYVLIESLVPARFLRYDETKNKLYLVRDLDVVDWEKLDPYIRRIRTVGIPSGPSGVPARTLDADTILRPLEAHLRRQAVDPRFPIPHLNHVIYHDFWTDACYSRILIHPRLEVLQLPMTAFTPYRKNHLNSDGIEGYDHDQFWTRHAQLWCSWDTTSLSHLSQLPTLTTLALEDGWNGGMVYQPRAEMTHRAFPALKHLLVSIAHADAPEFLEYIDPSSLDAVTIYWEYLHGAASSSGEVLVGIFTSLRTLRQPRHVRVVLDESVEQMICNPRSSVSSPELQYLYDSGNYLAPALSMTSLCDLEIGIDVIFQVDNEWLSTLATSLPNLESLSLVPLAKVDFSLRRFAPAESELEPDVIDDLYERWGLRRVLPTLDGLLALVEGCTRLARLKIAVESTISATTLSADGTWSKAKGRLRHMELWATGLDPGLADCVFAKFFTDYFPGLRHTSLSHGWKHGDSRSNFEG
ncbi:hypothetical protein PYCCODRAFT_1426500 [Trametes coccinea BRFM310]|uniref:Uncharacterized protein n=1 Tax=Trametes coccinea (strain BRFM310) TaxID=1353009 RepID=A0A1Y2IH33_TRAC3|nr:hypothetical protein PYCCODRAFT_1426500 [Trametes coccinea BRFM310]